MIPNRNLGLEYLDLYLLHWPPRLKKKDKYVPIEEEDILPINIRSTWAAMEDCQKLGLTKSIGVSNFSSKKLADLLNRIHHYHADKIDLILIFI